jgi:plasmid stabilization system protein ParE
VRLEWSRFALADRVQILDYIAADNSGGAVKVDERISKKLGNLIQFPNMGRLDRVEGTCELVISGTPYIAAYCIADEAVRILRILHGMQRWPDELGDDR